MASTTTTDFPEGNLVVTALCHALWGGLWELKAQVLWARAWTVKAVAPPPPWTSAWWRAVYMGKNKTVKFNLVVWPPTGFN